MWIVCLKYTQCITKVSSVDLLVINILIYLNNCVCVLSSVMLHLFFKKLKISACLLNDWM